MVMFNGYVGVYFARRSHQSALPYSSGSLADQRHTWEADQNIIWGGSAFEQELSTQNDPLWHKSGYLKHRILL